MVADLSPLSFDCVNRQGRVLRIEPPLSLVPFLDEEVGDFLHIEDLEIGLHVFAPSRTLLEEEIVQQLFFLWDEYAQEVPEKLTASAQQLQERLKRRMREETDAA
jgi:hypothetical protein